MTLRKGFFFNVNNLFASKGATTTRKIRMKKKEKRGWKNMAYLIMEKTIGEHVRVKSNNPNFD